VSTIIHDGKMNLRLVGHRKEEVGNLKKIRMFFMTTPDKIMKNFTGDSQTDILCVCGFQE